jgi:hypothetical protein
MNTQTLVVNHGCNTDWILPVLNSSGRCFDSQDDLQDEVLIVGEQRFGIRPNAQSLHWYNFSMVGKCAMVPWQCK